MGQQSSGAGRRELTVATPVAAFRGPLLAAVRAVELAVAERTPANEPAAVDAPERAPGARPTGVVEQVVGEVDDRCPEQDVHDVVEPIEPDPEVLLVVEHRELEWVDGLFVVTGSDERRLLLDEIGVDELELLGRPCLTIARAERPGLAGDTPEVGEVDRPLQVAVKPGDNPLVPQERRKTRERADDVDVVLRETDQPGEVAVPLAPSIPPAPFAAVG
jgi:hypothetical protein